MKYDPTAHKHPAVVPANRGHKIEATISILQPPEVIYSFWRNIENLPRFMSHLESVTSTDETRSLWVAHGPAGTTVEWEAEIIGERLNEMLAWRSLEGSDIAIAGSVWFRRLPYNRGTEVRVQFKYDPKGGAVAARFAKILGDDPKDDVEEDLLRLKAFMETGEMPTTEGQPSGQEAPYYRETV